MRRMLFGAVAASVLVLGAAEPVITVDAKADRGPVRELVFGHNVEAADNRGIFTAPLAQPEPRGLEVEFGQGYWDAENSRPAPGVVEIMKTVPFGALRYPGGCLAHNYDWKLTVGPRGKRGSGNWAFGLDEYLETCRALGCEPQIIIPDYAMEMKALPQNAADLVEYLNMPAEKRYPWAMKRAEYGHPEPYGVKYFEIGNETIHGNHGGNPTRRYSPAEYVEYFNSVAAAMKKVDPSILVGTQTVLGGDEWDRAVYEGTAKNADFAIYHSYYPQVDSLEPGPAFRSVMAGNEQMRRRLRGFHRRMKEAGRDMPLGITEFNIRSIAGKKDAYRYSYLAGMQCAELWLDFLQPEANVLMANYWHLLNAMYGVIVTIPGADVPAGYDGKLLEMKAAARFFQTLKSHLGTELAATSQKNVPVFEANASPGVLAAKGDRFIPGDGPFVPLPLNAFRLNNLTMPGMSAEGSNASRSLTVRFRDFRQETYPDFVTVFRPKEIPMGRAWELEVSFEAKFTPAPDSTGSATIGLGMMDIRGWAATHNATAIYGINVAKEWTRFRETLLSLDDTQAMVLTGRVQHVQGAISGTLEIRDLRVAARPAGQCPAYQGLSSFASRSADGKTLWLIVFNRSLDSEIPAKIELEGFRYAAGSAEVLYQDDPGTVKYFEPQKEAVPGSGSSFRWKFKPHSMTAFTLTAGE